MKPGILLAGLITAAISLPAVSAPDAELADGNPGGQAPTGPLPERIHIAASAPLLDNGPLVNSPGTGAGGADESTLQTSLGMNTYGFGHQLAYGYRIADDFTSDMTWVISDIVFYAYQTGGGSASSTISSVNLRIWDGIPDDTPNDTGSQVIWGDSSANVMTSTAWSGIYRVLDTSSGSTNRAIMEQTIDMGNLPLAAGTYWLDWQTDGSLSSGPWAPPVTINGETTTGNALQWTSSWAAVTDSGTGTAQGFPFIINGASPGIHIVKQTIGGDDSFSFTSATLEDFEITTSNNKGSWSFPGLPPGSYDVEEIVPAGWSLTASSCNDDDSVLPDLELAADESLICTFDNTKHSSITVIKETVGPNGTFNFTSTSLPDFEITTAGNTGQQVFKNQAPGVYDISETVPDGWLLEASCDDGSDPSVIDLALGEDVTCTFVNYEMGSITVIKNTLGGDDTFSFTSSRLGDFDITTMSGTGQTAFTELKPGIYYLKEIILDGWSLTDFSCDDDSLLPAVEVDPGENVICSFENTKKGSITVLKNALGDDGVFDFVSSSLGDFHITTVEHTGEEVFHDLIPGTYDLAEGVVPAGWQLTASSCDNLSTLPDVEVAPGEAVNCSFTNSKLGSITVIKKTVGIDGTFSFTSSSLPDFKITTTDNTGQQVFSGLLPDTYDLHETVPAGWSLDASCDDGSILPDVKVAANEHVTCTFVNTELGSITVLKQTLGGDDTFGFTSSRLGDFPITTLDNTGQHTVSDLMPGSYDLSEIVRSGWSLTGFTCDDGSRLPNIELAPGEDVTCSFENTKLGSIVVSKNALGGDASFSFTSSSLGDFAIATEANSGQQVFSDLTPGTYDIDETVPAGWVLTSTGCDDGSVLPLIHVAPGEQVNCEFTNARLGSITVIKNTLGADDTFAFTSSSLGDFDITTLDNTGQHTMPDLLPGTYDLAEDLHTGWSLTGSACEDGSILPNIELAPGEVVTCRFENTLDDPQLKLTKSAAPANYVMLGDNIVYSFVVENSGNVALTEVKVADPLTGLGSIDCDATGSDTLASLAASASAGCEAMYSITQADLDTGSVTNQASANGLDPAANEVSVSSNEVTISKLVNVCYEGGLTIPDGMIFKGPGTTSLSATVSIDTGKPATAGVMIDAPHTLILTAPTLEFNPLFDVEGDPGLQNPPAGGQLRVIIDSVSCQGRP